MQKKQVNIKYWIIFICFIIISSHICIIFFRGNKTITETPEKQPEKNIKQNMNWPIFRGDAQLSGNASAELNHKFNLEWTFKTNGKITSSPVIYNDIVYIGSHDRYLYAIGLNSGKKIWSFETDEAVEAPPLYFENSIFASSAGGFVYKLDAINGDLIWKFKAGERIAGSANILTAKNRKIVVFGSYDNTLYALNFKTGKKIWEYSTDNYINGTPSVFLNKILFGGCDAKCHILEGINGKKIASIHTGSYIPGSIAVIKNFAFLGNYEGELVCLDLINKSIKWKYSDKNTGPFVSSPSVKEDKIVIGSQDKNIYCISNVGNLVWSFKTGGNVDSSPVILFDKVIAGSSDGWVYLLDLNDGKELWSYEIGAPVTSSVAVSGNRIVVCAHDGTIYVFEGGS